MQFNTCVLKDTTIMGNVALSVSDWVWLQSTSNLVWSEETTTVCRQTLAVSCTLRYTLQPHQSELINVVDFTFLVLDSI